MMLQNLVGFWNGTTTDDAFLQYTQLEIFTSNGDTLHLRLLSRMYEVYPEPELEWTGAGTFTCVLPHFVLAKGTRLDGRFDPSRQVLTVNFHGSIFDVENYQVELRRDDPACRKYRRAALSLEYEYRVPDRDSTKGYFEPGNAAEQGLSIGDIKAMVQRLLRLNSGKRNDAQVDGILILKDGKLVLEEYFWGLSSSDHHDISSCTKSITSLLFGIAWDMGLINLEQPVTEIFPEISSDWSSNKEYEPIRLKHVLSMTSGTKLGEDLDEKMLCSDSIPKFVLCASRTSQPGSTYAYDNSLPLFAGLILERKTNTSIELFAQEHFFKPLSIKDPRWTYLPSQKSIDGSRFPMTTGAMMLPLRDFAKLGQLLLNKGQYAGRQVVSQAWLELSTSQHTLQGQYPYGFYWHLNTPDQRHFHGLDGVLAIGQGEQICAVVPEMDMVVAWMSSTWVNRFGYRVGLKVVDEEFLGKVKGR